MSAESPRRMSKGTGSVVRPQAVSDKTVMESVVDFFQDVALSQGQPKQDDREKIQWVSFEHGDINDINSNPDCTTKSGNMAPVLLVLGYTNGVQIWTLPASGDAQEVLSIRQGPVRILRLLPTPEPVFERPDLFASKRPLVVMCDASSAGQPFCSVKFVSLRSGDELRGIAFKFPVVDIKCNPRVVVVAFSERIEVFDSCQFRQLFWTMSCFPCPGPNENPFALGTRWLAYADKKLLPLHQSCGGMSGDGGQSYAATVISAAKTLTKGLTMFGETVASSLTGAKPQHTAAKKKEVTSSPNDLYRPGVVTILDTQRLGDGEVTLQEDSEGEGIVAHFPAHVSEPVAAMNFDPSGTMLLTADKLGHHFHLFRIMAHPWSCSLGTVHHLYTLYRGDTTAKVQDITFSNDSRWVAVSTWRGTTHVFPVTPYGGPVTMRTHTSRRMVNRASRYHRSAGLEDMDPRVAGKDSPVHVHGSGSPGSSPGRHEQLRHILHHNAINNNITNPRLPPFPHPTTVTPLVQIKHALSIPGLGSSGGSGKKTKNTGKAPVATTDLLCVATCFARSRGWLAGSPGTASREKSGKADAKRPVDSLYILSWTGTLVEYVLDPHAKVNPDKVTEESPLEVTETARAQWTLGRSIKASEMRPPLPSNNPLLMACDAVTSQRPSGDMFGGGGTVTRHESQESLSSDHSSRDDPNEQWLSQVEIITHAGPHRRLWMGPQFSFKTFQGTATVLSSNSSALLSQSPEMPQMTGMDLVSEEVDLQSLRISESRSSPVAMPGSRRSHRASSGSEYTPSPSAGVLLQIEAGSYEQSPSLEAYTGWPGEAAVQPPVHSGEVLEDDLREHIADAMNEASAGPATRDMGPTTRDMGPAAFTELDQASMENLSTSSGSAGSATARAHSFDARSSPPHSIEQVLVFPGGNCSPDSN